MIKSVKEFLAEIEKISKDNKMYFYRGQCNSTWVDIPNLFRKNYSEKELFHEIITEMPEEFLSESLFGKLIKMQHYGIPTRLLDVTSNPLIALFFSVNCEQNESGKNGVVLVYDVDYEEVLNIESDKALIITSFARLSHKDQKEIMKYCSEHKHQILDQHTLLNESINNLYHEIKREFPGFDYRISTDDLLKNYFINGLKNNSRIKNQNGGFILFHGVKATENSYQAKKIFVDMKYKENILNELESFGINPGKVYYQLDKISKYIADSNLKRNSTK